MKELSDKEKKRKKNERELKSLMNKMSGDNLIWFKSLGKTKQFDFLFEWKREKYTNPLKQTKVSEQIDMVASFDNNTGDIIFKSVNKKVKSYPPSLKHFIRKSRKRFKYRVNKEKTRAVTLDMLLNDIKKQ